MKKKENKKNIWKANVKKICFEGEILINASVRCWLGWVMTLNKYNTFTNLFIKSRNIHEFDILKYKFRIDD